MDRPLSFLLGYACGTAVLLAVLYALQALPITTPVAAFDETATAQFGHDGTTCYAFKLPQADGLGEHLIFCEDGRYGIHNGAAFMPRLYPEEVAE